MTNPFDDAEATFHVLVNEENQYSQWPSHLAVPGGWTVVLSARPKAECVEFVEREWTDMRPRSLVVAMDRGPRGEGTT